MRAFRAFRLRLRRSRSPHPHLVVKSLGSTNPWDWQLFVLLLYVVVAGGPLGPVGAEMPLQWGRGG